MVFNNHWEMVIQTVHCSIKYRNSYVLFLYFIYANQLQLKKNRTHNHHCRVEVLSSISLEEQLLSYQLN